ncbi:hypothetical protein SBA5_50053 [Candidatus Sulfotelmatomonas gaucii]|uniref:Uncharacterized protein n=1 Tax=Candidatus Sulfuritelmatomonas gaucii TaxID=2043161 RepID=A0A2N9LQJ0_9BACT|nr:hypothetical protein SBA5_50053 [Candidatus Sulfotelmatomonas gaucii]
MELPRPNNGDESHSLSHLVRHWGPGSGLIQINGTRVGFK